MGADNGRIARHRPRMHAGSEPDQGFQVYLWAHAQGLLLKDKWALVTGASYGISPRACMQGKSQK